MHRSCIMYGCTCTVILSMCACVFGIPSLKATYEVTYFLDFPAYTCDKDIKQQYKESYKEFEVNLRRQCMNNKTDFEVGIFALEQLSISTLAFQVKYNFTIQLSGNGLDEQRQSCVRTLQIVLQGKQFLDPFSNISCNGSQQIINNFNISIIKSQYICSNGSSEVNGSCIEHRTLLVSSSTSASLITTNIPKDEVTTNVRVTADIDVNRTSPHKTKSAVTDTTATLSTLAQSTQREETTEPPSGNKLNVIYIIVPAAGVFVIVLIAITIAIIRRKNSTKLDKTSHNVVSDGIPESNIKRKSDLSEMTDIVNNHGERNDHLNDGILKDNVLYVSYSDNTQDVDKRSVETKNAIEDTENVQMNLYAVVNKPKHGKDGTSNSHIGTKNLKTNIRHPAESNTYSQIQKSSQEEIKKAGVTQTEMPRESTNSTIRNNLSSQINTPPMQQNDHSDQSDHGQSYIYSEVQKPVGNPTQDPKMKQK